MTAVNTDPARGSPMKVPRSFSVRDWIDVPGAYRSGEREARLVFALAGDVGDETPRHEDLNWSRLQHIAALENATIATHRYIRRARPASIPLAAERQLACIALQTEFRMRRLEQRLRESLAALAAAGIRVTLLKGAALASTLYDSFAARPMNDVDVLIDEDRAAEARDILFHTGWQDDPGLPSERWYTGHHHLPPLLDRSGTGLRFEIHTTLLPRENPFDVPVAALQRDSREVRIGGTSARVLSPTHHAVYAAIHFAWSHEVGTGAWHTFRDLGTLARSELFTWDAFVRTAEAWRAGTCAYWTLRLARALSGLSVPDDVLRRLEPALPEVLLLRLERHFARLVLRHAGTCPSVRLTQFLWTLAMCPLQSGHGDRRPWLVSPGLRAARLRIASPSSEPRRPFHHVRQVLLGSVYLTSMI